MKLSWRKQRNSETLGYDLFGRASFDGEWLQAIKGDTLLLGIVDFRGNYYEVTRRYQPDLEFAGSPAWGRFSNMDEAKEALLENIKPDLMAYLT